jgi:hypothetical protein
MTHARRMHSLYMHQTRTFPRNAEGLHAYKPKAMSQECHIIDTVAKNRKNYTLRQFERTKVACTLYHILGAPSIENFKCLLRTNQIKNCPVMVEDVTIPDRIFGPNMSTLKGKSKRGTPRVAQKDIIEIPKELIKKHHNLELYIDVMFINKLPFLTGIDGTIKYRMIATLKTREHDEAVLRCTRQVSVSL